MPITSSNCFRQIFAAVAALSFSLFTIGAAHAGDAIITVTTLNDQMDVAGSAQIGDLPGSDGDVSFREAVTAANNTPGPQSIHFAIPQSQWWLVDEYALLKLEDGVFQVTDDETTIDFTTQTDFSGDTNPNGWEVGIYGLQPNGWGAPAIIISADDCTVIGLHRVMQRGYAVSITGNNNRVINCTISGPIHDGVKIAGPFGGEPATGNVIGGTEPDEGNELSGGNAGVRIEAPAEDNLVIGNVISGGSLGVLLIGSQYTTTVNNNRIGGPTPQQRNVIANAGSFCCEGAPSGAQVAVRMGVGNIIEGNYIGTTPDGSAGAGQLGPIGVEVLDSADTVIRNNVIADIYAIGVNHFAGDEFGIAINVIGESANTIIQSNAIGTDATGQDAIPNFRGIVVSPLLAGSVPTNTLIGGENETEGNTIAHSMRTGVRVTGSVTGATIANNRIFNNGLLGIDLDSAGVTPNDNGDNDGGSNNRQNFPVITDATATGSTIAINGTFNSHASQEYVLEFFASPQCDASGHGEGATVLGSITVQTDNAGNASFNASLPFEPATTGELVTATATRQSTGDTSEFSACSDIIIDDMPADLDGDGTVGVGDLLMLLSAWGACDGSCPADVNNSGVVDINDLLTLLSSWG